MLRKFFKTALFWSLLIVGGLMILNELGWLERPKNLVFNLVRPSQEAGSEVAFNLSHFFNYFKDKKSLIDEKDRLEEASAQLLAEKAELIEVRKENEFLRQQLGLGPDEEKQLVLAAVIGQEPTNLAEYLIINKGTQDQVQENDAVIVSQNILVGRVSEVSQQTAKVLLVTDPSSLVNVVVQENRTKGMVKGKKPNELMMELILQEDSIDLDQTIITSGLSGVFPAGLLIGQVKEVISSDPQIFQQAKIEPAADFDNLERVFVIIGS